MSGWDHRLQQVLHPVYAIGRRMFLEMPQGMDIDIAYDH